MQLKNICKNKYDMIYLIKKLEFTFKIHIRVKSILHKEKEMKDIQKN